MLNLQASLPSAGLVEQALNLLRYCYDYEINQAVYIRRFFSKIPNPWLISLSPSHQNTQTDG